MTSSRPLSVDIRVTGEQARLRPVGDIDLATAPRLEAAVRRQVEAGLARVVVDLSGVSFCDCAGLRALHASRRFAVAAGTAFAVTDPSVAVLRLVELSCSDLLADMPAVGASRHGPARVS